MSTRGIPLITFVFLFIYGEFPFIEIMLEVNIIYIDLLLKELCLRTRKPMNSGGFEKISRLMNNGVTQRYLYENLWIRIGNVKKDGKDSITVNRHYVDQIAIYLGFRDFDYFVQDLENRRSSALMSIEGVYYCYLRKNAVDEKIVFQSPVKVEKAEIEMIFTLQGPNRQFVGEISYQEGCLFCTMAGGGKSFHHVYQIDKHENPKVLKGIFSGISSSGNPLGGRCVLIKMEQSFEDLKTEALNIDDMLATSNVNHQKLAHYFESFEKNNLRIIAPHEFNITDLSQI